MSFSRTPKLKGKLVHWHYDTWVVEWDIRELKADAFASFHLDTEGAIGHLTMKPVSPLVDFSYDFQDLNLIKIK